MNVKRFTARTSREALALVRQSLGADAVVLSTRAGADGVEVLALASDGLRQIEQAGARATMVRAAHGEAAELPQHATPALPAPRRELAPTAAQAVAVNRAQAARASALDERVEPRFDVAADDSVERDVEALGMSTLTFQDYVRERMLKRRQSEIDQAAAAAPRAASAEVTASAAPQRAVGLADAERSAPAAVTDDPVRRALRVDDPVRGAVATEAPGQRSAAIEAPTRRTGAAGAPRRDPPVLRDEIRLSEAEPAPAERASLQRERHEMLGELRSMKQLIEERFGMLAFMEKLQRDPRQAELSQQLLDTGLSPALVRKLVDSLPHDAEDALAWATDVLERNVLTDEREAALEDSGGVFALIGSTGVGKTTSTAKIAAAFATRHGAANLGLVTLDAYRIGAHEQLRTYGRILGVPVHTAHDRASLEDLLELLAAKTMVLIDTAGMAQRDSRTRELLEMLSHRSINKLLVVNAAAQGETVEDVMIAYGAAACRGVIVSKLDEAVKLGPALDALIRHKCKVVGVANGQRVPEDWHRLSAQALVQRVLRGGGSSSWRLDAGELNLLFAGRHAVCNAALTA